VKPGNSRFSECDEFILLTSQTLTRSVLLLAACLISAPALSLGGDAASEAGGRLEGRTVMVLGSRGSVCSGTVVSPTIILTAGHCVSGSGQYAIAYKEAGGSPTLQEVRQVARHPEFKPGTKVSIDMALVRLKLPLPSRFSAVALDADADDDGVGSRMTLAGFGLAREGDEKSAGTLRSATVTVLPRFYPRYFRLGLSGGGISVCKGDSGGPVFSDGLTGITLSGVIYASERQRGGRQCGDVAQAVRIAPQRAWIDRVMAQWAQ
jgi:secreted trypsin-like serine protease